jgi:hypothetical protein
MNAGVPAALIQRQVSGGDGLSGCQKMWRRQVLPHSVASAGGGCSAQFPLARFIALQKLWSCLTNFQVPLNQVMIMNFASCLHAHAAGKVAWDFSFGYEGQYFSLIGPVWKALYCRLNLVRGHCASVPIAVVIDCCL